MKILPRVIVGIFACAIGAGIIWYEWRQLNPPPNLVISPAASAQQPQNAATTNQSASKEAGSVDNAEANAATAHRVWFKDLVVQKAHELAKSAEKEDADSVAADEMSLPRAALPLLQFELNKKALSDKAAKSIQSALDADASRVKLAVAEKKVVDWYYLNTLAIFDDVAPTHVEWHGPARSAIGAWGREFSGDPGATGDEDPIMWSSARTASQEGCDDPLLLFVRAQNEAKNGVGWDKLVKLTQRAEKLMEKSQYPKIFQLYATLFALECMGKSDVKADADPVETARLIGRVNAIFPDAISAPNIPEQVVINLFTYVGDASVAIYGDRRKLTAPLFDQLEKSKVRRTIALTIKGDFNVNYAWDARGDGMGDSVTQEGWRLMAERLKKADAALEEAWSLDHNNKYAATAMLHCELGQGKGKDWMELWFQRAIAADPEYYQAYTAKLYYLEPKWYGSKDEMLTFARQASKSAPPDSAVRVLIVKAHRDASQYSTGGNGWDNPRYFQHNPTAWTDIHDAFTAYLPYHTESRRDYIRYAELAAYCGQWREAHWAFMQIPADYYDWGVFSSQEEQYQLSQSAAQQAAFLDQTHQAR